MDFVLKNLSFIVLAASVLGFGALGWLIRGLKRKIDRICGGAFAEEGMEENLLRRVIEAEDKMAALQPRIDLLERVANVSIQKVGFLRFNPFHDTGGDNSFTLALLDGENNGVLVSSFYAREGVRIYAKNIVHGHTRYPLSGEEKKVLEETVKK